MDMYGFELSSARWLGTPYSVLTGCEIYTKPDEKIFRGLRVIVNTSNLLQFLPGLL